MLVPLGAVPHLPYCPALASLVLATNVDKRRQAAPAEGPWSCRRDAKGSSAALPCPYPAPCAARRGKLRARGVEVTEPVAYERPTSKAELNIVILPGSVERPQRDGNSEPVQVQVARGPVTDETIDAEELNS